MFNYLLCMDNMHLDYILSVKIYLNPEQMLGDVETSVGAVLCLCLCVLCVCSISVLRPVERVQEGSRGRGEG